MSISPLRAFFKNSTLKKFSSILFPWMKPSIRSTNCRYIWVNLIELIQQWTLNLRIKIWNWIKKMCWYERNRLFFNSKKLMKRLLWCLSENASSSLGRNSRSVVMILKLHKQEGNNVLKHINIDLQRCMMMRESQGFVCFSCKSRLHKYICSIKGVAQRRTQAVIKDEYKVTVVT